MPILPVTPHQLRALSAFARSEPTRDSPLQRLGLLDPGDVERDVQWLLHKRLLVPAGRDIRLSASLEPLLFMLHRPEQAIAITRVGRVAPQEVFACRSGKVWALDQVGFERPDALATEGSGIDLLVWPVPDERMGTWLAEEVVDGAHLCAPGTEWQVHIPLGGWVLLLAMQAAYRDRLRGRPLSGSELWLTRDDLVAHTDEVLRVMRPFTDAEGVDAYFRERWHRFAESLAEARLVHLQDQRLAYTKTTTAALDPGRLAGVVRLTGLSGGRASARMLYLLDAGGLLVSEAEGASLTVRRIHPANPQIAWRLLTSELGCRPR